jgi:putative heme-binding domain-containing protein
MTRRHLSFFVVLIGLCVLAAWRPWQVHAQAAPAMQWIWFDEGNPLVDAPADSRYFRRAFDVERANSGDVTSANLEITADNRFIVWVNGTRVGQGDSWAELHRFNVLTHLLDGKNVIAVQAINEGGPAGLVVHLRWTPKGKKPREIVSDGSWKTVKAAGLGWWKSEFDDAKWSKARVLGPYGRVGPWGTGGGGAPGTPPQRKFTVPDGYKVELAVKVPDDRGPFSLVNMTFDARGRLLVSQEGGSILLCTKPDDKGVLQEVRDYCSLVKNCHGMCWANDSLYLVGNGPKGTGLYRCRDTKGKDVIDEATLVHRFDGGMGEHGPHAVIHGPDNKLYVCIGNHAHARIGPKQSPNPEKLAENSPLRRWPTGGQGPDQGQKGSTEDVLLPRLNDANGHAANIRAPGGTIWRMDLDGKNVALVSAGFRNQFDAAFSPTGELFSFDSDMEWDEGLPWYRAVRVLHCPPGSDFVWRTGAANTPNYYIDSLPPIYETGRGSPVGVTFCDGQFFGKKYDGAFFMADWSIGVIYALHLKRKGASYEAKPERFLVGTPANVTDLEFGPNGCLYFTMGGRGSHGGVYRVVWDASPVRNLSFLAPTVQKQVPRTLVDTSVQPLSAWSRRSVARTMTSAAKIGFLPDNRDFLLDIASDSDGPLTTRLRALLLWQLHGEPKVPSLVKLAASKDAAIRAQIMSLLGASESTTAKNTLLGALADDDAMVRRRACEALIRAGIEPEVKALWPLLADDDQFVRTAARLVLERIDPKKWVAQLGEQKDLPAWEAIIALCKTGKAAEYADAIFERLKKSDLKGMHGLLGYLRTVQLACFHVSDSGGSRPPLAAVKEIASSCDKLFPYDEKLVNRELAILLTQFRRTGVIDSAVGPKLLAAIEASKGDRQQQIHYFYCLLLLHDGWTKEQKAALARWYESTRTWSGGASYTGFLGNIFRDCLTAYDLADRKALLDQGETLPQACLILAQRLQNDRQTEMLPALKTLAAKVETKSLPRAAELRRHLEDAIVRTISDHPRAEDYPDLLRALASTNKLAMFDALVAIKRIPTRPKSEDAQPFRTVLLAATKLDAGNRWKAVELLRHWTNDKQFGAEIGQWQPELQAWSRWFAQSFPKEPPLPDVEGEKTTPAKYKYDELLHYLMKGEGHKGDVKKGRFVFEKASCLKCHKYGKEGEGLGPDLTTLSKRFKRADVLESIYYPSKVISDQYRSTTFLTFKGQRIEGLAAVQGDTITVLQSDGTKVTLRKKDIDQQYASLVSVMPEKLLDALSKTEIADLFAFLESEPDK